MTLGRARELTCAGAPSVGRFAALTFPSQQISAEEAPRIVFWSWTAFHSKKLPSPPTQPTSLNSVKKKSDILLSYFSNEGTWDSNVVNTLNGIYTGRQLLALQKGKKKTCFLEEGPLVLLSNCVYIIND